ncbi:MAG: U32 family peptidase [Christensenellales bacterium]
MEKLKTAIYFGADAVYVAGKNFGLRAFAGNFDLTELEEATLFCHEKGKKIYVTVNIIAHNSDFEGLKEYLEFLQKIEVDGVIVADLGVASFVKKYAPNLELHISTQANIINKYSAELMAHLGAKRIVLARELGLQEIKEIRAAIPKDVELECFVHGAMCISYSGRCLLSNYLNGRDSNKGACVQACRWEYSITEKSRKGQQYEIQEDDKGTYILNSKDLCMINHIQELIDAGVDSLKIEGRMKSPYYVATVTNAYRRKIDQIYGRTQNDINYVEEVEKTSHRLFTTGFFYPGENKENLLTSTPIQSHEFIAVVKNDAKDGFVLVEMRNQFKIGDELEVLSPNDTFNKKLVVTKILDEDRCELECARRVQQLLMLETDLPLKSGDILRRKND